jgi:hypothetical protein
MSEAFLRGFCTTGFVRVFTAWLWFQGLGTGWHGSGLPHCQGVGGRLETYDVRGKAIKAVGFV